MATYFGDGLAKNFDGLGGNFLRVGAWQGQQK